MLYATLRDGRSRAWDLLDPTSARDWVNFETDPRSRSLLTSLALGTPAHRADLPLPRRFRRLRFRAEVLRDGEGVPLAERLVAQADGVHLALTLHLNGRSGRVRVDLDNRGSPRWAPTADIP